MKHVIIAVILISICACMGRQKITESKAGTRYEVYYDSDGNIIKELKVSNALGPSIKGNGSNIKSPNVRSTPDSASIGSSALEVAVLPTSMTPLYIGGIAIIVISIAIGYFVNLRIAIVGGLCGLGIIIITRFLDMYPLLGMVGMAICALVALIYAVYTGYLGEQMKRTLYTIVPAINSLDDSKNVTEAISKTAETKGTVKTVKGIVTKIKQT